MNFSALKKNKWVVFLLLPASFAAAPGDDNDSHVVTIKVIPANKMGITADSLTGRPDARDAGNGSSLQWDLGPALKKITVSAERDQIDEAVTLFTVRNGGGAAVRRIFAGHIDQELFAGLGAGRGSCRIEIEPERDGRGRVMPAMGKVIFTVTDIH